MTQNLEGLICVHVSGVGGLEGWRGVVFLFSPTIHIPSHAIWGMYYLEQDHLVVLSGESDPVMKRGSKDIMFCLVVFTFFKRRET